MMYRNIVLTLFVYNCKRYRRLKYENINYFYLSEVNNTTICATNQMKLLGLLIMDRKRAICIYI